MKTNPSRSLAVEKRYRPAGRGSRSKEGLFAEKSAWVSLFYTNGNRFWHEDISQTLDHLQIAQIILFASSGPYITAMV